MSYLTEIWKDVLGFEGKYQVSDKGRVKSLDCIILRKDGKKYTQKGKLLRQSFNSGYLRVCVNRKAVKVHNLVASAFLGKRPEGFVIDHIDNDKGNNNLSNLKYVSLRENVSKDRQPKSGYTGVYYRANRNNWYSRIKIDGKYKFLGSGNDPKYLHSLYVNELKRIS